MGLKHPEYAPPAHQQRALVLDTNVVLDLLVFRDPSTALISALLATGAVRWIATPAMRAELERVLQYPRIARYLTAQGLEHCTVLARFDASTCVVADAPRFHALCQDPDDQAFVDLAAAHQAILLSRDKAVLRLHRHLQTCGAQVASSLESAGLLLPASAKTCQKQ